MSTVDAQLRYLWSAEFADGSIIDQPQNDRYSKHDNAAESNPSAFRDVLDKDAESDLVRFALVGDGERWEVDLLTGEFIHNGRRFDAHPQTMSLDNKLLKVVFWRETRRESVVTGHVDEDGSFAVDIEGDERHFINRYLIGWQVVGEDFTQTIALK